MDAKLIAEMVAALSAKTLTPEHSHMLKPWEMVFGGLVLPMLAEGDETVKDSPKFAELTARYSREAVEKFFAVREVERVVEVEKVIEKPVTVEKIVEKVVKVGSAERAPTLHDTVEVGGKFRRLKDKVAKIARKEDEISAEGHDIINTWWNANQKRADEGECQILADAINRISGTKPLSASQVAGWISWLCRIALWLEAERADYVKRALKRGKFNVAPEFSAKFIADIANNKQRQADDRELALAAKKKMEAEVEANMKALPTSAAGVQAAQAGSQVTA